MFHNYLKIALRNLRSNRINTSVNIIGLALGITSTLIIAFIINYELGYDAFHSHFDQIYRVVRVSQVEGETEYRTGTSWPLSPAIKNEIASLQDMTYMMYLGGAEITIFTQDGSDAHKFQEDKGLAFVNESFFEIFDFKNAGVKWLYGDPKTALDKPNSVVLTESSARKYYGAEPAIGKSVRINQMIDVTVTGVISDLPSNTNFPFTLICSYSTIYDLLGKQFTESWSSVSDSHQTYILLPDGMSKNEMEKEITKVHEKYVNENIAAMRTYPLQALHEVHRDSRFGNYNNKFTSMTNLLVLGIVGIFLLLMISINFINLSIANSVSRSKEIGLRKVMGGKRTQIIIQFLIETFTLTFFASVLALIAAELLKPELQNLFEFQIDGLFITHRFALILILIIILLITISAGLYPAVVQSRYSPISILKNTITSKIGKSIRVSNALILVQFTFTIMLITGTLIVIQQIKFFNSVDLGFEKDAVIYVNLPENKPASLSTFKNKLLSNSTISEVSFSSSLPSGLNRSRSYMDIKRKGANSDENIIYEYHSIDPEYLNLYRLQLLDGSNLHYSDTNRSVIINQTLMRKLGYAGIDECIGSEVDMGLENPCIITGVLKDFHNQSLKEEFGKIAMVHNPNNFSVASIKLNLPKNEKNTEYVNRAIQHVQNSWDEAFTEQIFEYKFLDENIEAFYKQEQRISKLLRYLSIIFLLIGCLGIYGLISFLINKKMKELAIRKILGATTLNVYKILLQNYFLLIGIAFLISFPIVHYLMSRWLENYNYHIELHWWYYITPPIFVLFITFFTISRNTYLAIKTNPADTLRNE